jgi:hypothetical protein
MNTTPIHELYLSGIIALCLVLPLMAGAWAPRDSTGRKPWLRTVWAGQAFGALGALLVIFSPLHPAYGLGVAVVSCVIFGWLLRRQLRPTRTVTR